MCPTCPSGFYTKPLLPFPWILRNNRYPYPWSIIFLPNFPLLFYFFRLEFHLLWTFLVSLVSHPFIYLAINLLSPFFPFSVNFYTFEYLMCAFFFPPWKCSLFFLYLFIVTRYFICFPFPFFFHHSDLKLTFFNIAFISLKLIFYCLLSQTAPE